MQRRPLANNFTPGTRIFNFIVCNTGELVGSGVAYTVTTGLYGMHLNRGELSENIGNFFENWPVKLNILTGGKVYIALIEGSANSGDLAHLTAGHQSIGHGDAQHWCQALNVETILQAQGKKLFLTDLAL